jgi:hypothetical protein
MKRGSNQLKTANFVFRSFTLAATKPPTILGLNKWQPKKIKSWRV